MARLFLPVIASEAKQSIYLRGERVDCFVAFAPLRKRFAFVAGNDANGRGVMTLTVG
jgi:hypothetical protein